MMNIHLSRPGGQREGPFTLDEINRDLAAHKYRETDFWAWYEGLTEWVPLHQVPGIVRSRAPESGEGQPSGHVPKYGAGDTEVIQHQDSPSDEPGTEAGSSKESTFQEPGSGEPEARPESAESEIEQTGVEEPATESSGAEEGGSDEPVSDESEPEELPSVQMGEQEPSPEEPAHEDLASEEASEETTEGTAAEETLSREPTPTDVANENVADPQPEAIPPSLARQLYSGMRFEALEQILLLSSGDAQAASRSVVTSGMLEAVAGQDLSIIREKIPRDAMGGCVFLEKLRGGGSISEAALRAASTLKPDLVRQAREGLYRICVRTYPIETGEIVALFLFYNKQLL